jgi:hypothetical protein
MNSFDIAFLIRIRQRGADKSDAVDRAITHLQLNEGAKFTADYGQAYAEQAGPTTILAGPLYVMAKPTEGEPPAKLVQDFPDREIADEFLKRLGYDPARFAPGQTAQVMQTLSEICNDRGGQWVDGPVLAKNLSGLALKLRAASAGPEVAPVKARC